MSTNNNVQLIDLEKDHKIIMIKTFFKSRTFSKPF